MGLRLDLQTILEGLLGNTNVYFQPPSNVQMLYPAIVYRRDDIDTEFAGNNPYRLTTRYQVTVISRNPDDVTPAKVAKLPTCVFDRNYVAENLNHDVFKLYF